MQRAAQIPSTEGLSQFCHLRHDRIFLQESHSIHHSYCQTKVMFKPELLATLSDKGKAMQVVQLPVLSGGSSRRVPHLGGQG